MDFPSRVLGKIPTSIGKDNLQDRKINVSLHQKHKQIVTELLKLINEDKIMKKQMTIGMMTIMMVLGTTTVNGKNHNQPRNEHNRHEVRVANNHKSHMDKCHACGRTYHMTQAHHCTASMPVNSPRPVVHRTNVSSVSTGIVVGAIVGAVISSLVK